MKQKESKIQLRTRKALEHSIGGFWFKVHGGPFQRAGIPDLLGCVMGLYIGVELKTDVGKTSTVQKEVMRLIRRESGITFVARTPQQAVDRLAERLRKRGKITKNEAIRISETCSTFLSRRKKRRIIHGAGDWEDHYRSGRRRKIVVKTLS